MGDVSATQLPGETAVMSKTALLSEPTVPSETALPSETGRTPGASTGTLALETLVAASRADGRPTVTTRGDTAHRDGFAEHRAVSPRTLTGLVVLTVVTVPGPVPPGAASAPLDEAVQATAPRREG